MSGSKRGGKGDSVSADHPPTPHTHTHNKAGGEVALSREEATAEKGQGQKVRQP